MLSPWIVIPIYFTTFFIVVLILRVVDWGKLMIVSEKNTNAARALFLVVSLGISAAIGTMIVILASLAF